MKSSLHIIICLVMLPLLAIAGNPDRQGQAGAYELAMNPWARSAGLHSLNFSNVSGVEAMRLNPAGIARVHKTEVLLSQSRYLVGTGINMSSFGLVTKLKKAGVLGVSLAAVSFGDIEVTNEDIPDGAGTYYSPNFFHLGIAYGYTFENKVTVGFLFRAISESLSNISASGFAVDAGVQYVTGDNDQFKFGVSLRNIGTPMVFGGEGLTSSAEAANGVTLTYSRRGAKFELPSSLNIGASYDFFLTEKHDLTAVGGFVSNSFSRDQLGAGLEYSFDRKFMLRVAYKNEIGGQNDFIEKSLDNGLSAGVSMDIPLGKKSANDILGIDDDTPEVVKEPTRLGIDYSYRVSTPFSGTHNFSLRINL